MSKLKNDELEMLRKLVCTKHIYGLPIGEGMEVLLYYDNSGFTFIVGNQSFGLGYDVITDLSIKTEKEIATSYVSNPGGAVAGGMMFGPIGAIIGGKSEKITSTTQTEYLIITYNGKYICLQLSHKFGCLGEAGALTSKARAKISHEAGVSVNLSESNSNYAKQRVSQYKPNDAIVTKIRSLVDGYEERLQKDFNSKAKIIFIVFSIPIIIAILICLAAKYGII